MCRRSGMSDLSLINCPHNMLQFKARYLQLNKDVDKQKSTQSKTTKKGLHILLRELSDDEDIVPDNNSMAPEDPDRPWLQYLMKYIDTVEQVPEGWSTIKWWGVSFMPFPSNKNSTSS